MERLCSSLPAAVRSARTNNDEISQVSSVTLVMVSAWDISAEEPPSTARTMVTVKSKNPSASPLHRRPAFPRFSCHSLAQNLCFPCLVQQGDDVKSRNFSTNPDSIPGIVESCAPLGIKKKGSADSRNPFSRHHRRQAFPSTCQER